MIQTTSIQFSYDGVRQMRFPDVKCNDGEGLLILGPSGCGKTTLLHMMAGLLAPRSGQVVIGKKDLYQLSSAERRKLRANEIGLVFQVPHFIAALSMEENLLMAQSLSGRKKNTREIQDYFNELQIGHRLKAKPSELSQGELQRASLIRAIINEPSVILADEPTSALDDESAQKVTELLRKYAEQNGSALVIVTHDNRLKDIMDDKILLSKIQA